MFAHLLKGRWTLPATQHRPLTWSPLCIVRFTSRKSFYSEYLCVKCIQGVWGSTPFHTVSFTMSKSVLNSGLDLHLLPWWRKMRMSSKFKNSSWRDCISLHLWSHPHCYISILSHCVWCLNAGDTGSGTYSAIFFKCWRIHISCL